MAINMGRLSYIIVGSGYRAEYYARVAGTYPQQFRALFLCRSEEKAAKMLEKTGIQATTSIEVCERFGADFAVIAVNKENIADVCEEWADRGYPVVTETPAGASVEKLRRLWELHERRGARIAVCEQYHRYPGLAAGLEAVAAGKIGTPYSAYLSLAHDYHAASLLRRMLLVRDESFVMRGGRFRNPVVETDSRYGAVTDGHRDVKNRDVISIAFSSGKEAVYDFSGVQYRSFIRSRHLIVRGEKGEWNDNLIYCLDERNRPKREYLMPVIREKYAALDTQYLRDLRKTWQPELFLDMRQDEYAIATMLFDMQDYLAGGEEIYPLREALDDAYFWLLMNEAVASPWEEVRAQHMPWHREK